MTVAKVSDFSQVYAALGETKRKIPARVLRFFKEQLYDLVHASADTDKKIAVVDYEDIETADEVEFVVGVGVARSQVEFGEKVTQRVQDALAKKGYEGITADEVFTDCLLDKSKFHAGDLLETAFPGYGRSNRTFIPVFRYLRSAGITSQQKLDESKYEGAKKVVRKLSGADYAPSNYASRYKKEFSDLSTKEIIEKAANATEAVLMLAFQPSATVDLDSLASFLRANSTSIEKEPYKTAYRKLVCRYDRLAFGF
ncbi:hypothetical protein MIC97_08835 [Aquamicrobium sp. NLF2-7]|uniref:hypothetical protein n=1 Tax=Aquamicrobium sp. NLF2-7 TaxID=2918753 RepID=UPI001EFB49B9|nr:hypothetical protein [Aquamicrobium sp. NLF2-7]MCG8271606.1 hypothetical protein [Aquamicrobium sp. NLF2-7]